MSLNNQHESRRLVYICFHSTQKERVAQYEHQIMACHYELILFWYPLLQGPPMHNKPHFKRLHYTM